MRPITDTIREWADADSGNRLAFAVVGEVGEDGSLTDVSCLHGGECDIASLMAAAFARDPELESAAQLALNINEVKRRL